MKLTPKGDFLLLDDKIQIVLDDISLPFGIEKQYDNFVCKLSLNKENYILFQNIENEIREKLLETEYELKSQINEYKNFKTLNSKLFMVKNNIVTEIIDKNSNIIPYTEIQRKDKANIIIYFDKLWIKNNIAYYKWKVVFIKLTEPT